MRLPPVPGATSTGLAGCFSSQSMRAAPTGTTCAVPPAPPHSSFCSFAALQAGQATSFVDGLPVAAKATSASCIFDDSSRSEAVQARVGRSELNTSSVPNQNGMSAVW